MVWMILWLIVFLVAVYGVGFYYSRKIESDESYLMADHSLGFFPICGSIIATALGSAAVIGSAGKGFTMGFVWQLVTSPYAIFSVILALLLGAVIRRMKLTTIPQLFIRRFGKVTGLAPSLIISVLYMTPTFAMQLIGMAAIFTTIFKLGFVISLLFSFVICVGFTLMGGLPSVAWTDAVQAVLMLGGLVILCVLSLIKVGGWDILYAAQANSFDLLKLEPEVYMKWACIYGPFYLVWQTTWQRFSAAKSEKVAVKAVSWGYVLAFFIGFAATFVGICAKMELPAGTRPDLVFTTWLNIVAHPAIGGLFMVSLFAALLTGATSFLLSGATNISQDIVKTYVKPEASSQDLLKYSRWSVAGMAILGLVIAFTVKDIITIYTYALSLSAVTLVAPVMAAMFWKRATKKGVLLCIFGSLIFTLTWRVLGRPFGLHEIIPGLIVSFSLLVGGSLFTEHAEEEEVVSYYHFYKAQIRAEKEA